MKEKTSREKYTDAQKAFIEMTGLKVGSKVKILRMAESYQFGWAASWQSPMKSIGEFIVGDIDDDDGIRFKGQNYYYPFFVLEVIQNSLPEDIPLTKEGGYSVKFKEGGDIAVGCQDISYDKLKKIYDTATSVVNR